MERGRRGLLLGRALLGIAVLAIVLGGFLFIAAPGYRGGPATIEVLGIRFAVELVTFTIGVIGPIVGLAWMWRIHRAHREPEVHPWRYRDFD